MALVREDFILCRSWGQSGNKQILFYQPIRLDEKVGIGYISPITVNPPNESGWMLPILNNSYLGDPKIAIYRSMIYDDTDFKGYILYSDQDKPINDMMVNGDIFGIDYYNVSLKNINPIEIAYSMTTGNPYSNPVFRSFATPTILFLNRYNF